MDASVTAAVTSILARPAADPIPPLTVHPDVIRANALIDRSFVFNIIPDVISSPIDVHILQQFLRQYPHSLSSLLIIQGFVHGVDVGFRSSISSTFPRNLLSARLAVQGVSDAIRTEVMRGHTSGPFFTPPFPIFHCSPLGAVSKPDKSIRLILDLSSPRNASMNDGISKEEHTVSYTRFDDAVALLRQLGPTCFMAKIDIRHAFRVCPVRQEDYHLLGFSWLNRYYFDLRLPFGSRSSPCLFNAFADALCWILVSYFSLAFVLHYSDDFFLINRDLPQCSVLMSAVLSIFAHLGVPVADDKLIGPSHTITYLGIEIDAPSMSIRLPAKKLIELQFLLVSWLSKKKCTKKELLSLTGKLFFAAKVVKPGRLFLRRLIDLSSSARKLHHHIQQCGRTRRYPVVARIYFSMEWHFGHSASPRLSSRHSTFYRRFVALRSRGRFRFSLVSRFLASPFRRFGHRVPKNFLLSWLLFWLGREYWPIRRSFFTRTMMLVLRFGHQE